MIVARGPADADRGASPRCAWRPTAAPTRWSTAAPAPTPRPRGFYEEFGDEPVEILVKGDLRQLLLTDNLGRLLALEGCLSGKAPGGQVISGQPAPPACAAIAQLDPSDGRLRPGDLPQPVRDPGAASCSASRRRRRPRRRSRRRRSRAAPGEEGGLSAAEQRAAAGAAAQQVLRQLLATATELAVQYGQTGLPRLDDPTFVSSVICDNRLPGCMPKPRLLGDRPQLRLGADLGPAAARPERVRAREAISLFRDAVADPAFRRGPARRSRATWSAASRSSSRGWRRSSRRRSSSCSRPPWRRW